MQQAVKRVEPARADLRVERHAAVPALVDALALSLPPAYAFLRAAWFSATSGPEPAQTLVALRECGTPIAAIPTINFGPSLIGGRAVPGSYWPFRALPIASDASVDEVAELLSHPLALATLGPVWRLGPTYAENPATTLLKQAGAAAGWTVLVRDLGHSFLFDTASGWPRASTRRRLHNYARQLAQRGEVRYDFVRGSDWSEPVLRDLAIIEQNSWVGRTTDGSGAKFLCASRRAEWQAMLEDPVLADALAATILRVDGQPAAFSFDLLAGSIQYSIASSFDERFAAFRPGKLVTAHQIELARQLGIAQIDFGTGDSGYKRDMGAVRGERILDLLFVRNRSAASVLKLKWGRESLIARDAYLAASMLRDAGRNGERSGKLEALLAMGALAAAAITFAE